MLTSAQMVHHVLASQGPEKNTEPGKAGFQQGEILADGEKHFYVVKPIRPDIEGRIAALPHPSLRATAQDFYAKGWDAVDGLLAWWENARAEGFEEGKAVGRREAVAQVAKEYAAVEDEATDAEAAALVGMDLATFQQYKPQAEAQTPEEEDEEAARLAGMTVEEYRAIMRELDEEAVDADSKE